MNVGLEAGERIVYPPPDGTIWDALPALVLTDDCPAAVGAPLDERTLIGAYRRGIFPWPAGDEEGLRLLPKKIAHGRRRGITVELEPGVQWRGVPVPWEAPATRGVIPVDGARVNATLRRRLRRVPWTITVDRAFDAVIAACAARSGDETWITPPMQEAYSRLHSIGWAHSCEVWDGEALVGGSYGVLVGGVFTAESSFFTVSDASKVAILGLVARLRRAGGTLFDTQVLEEPAVALGARAMPGHEFFELLLAERDRPTVLDVAPKPASSLVADLFEPR